MASERERYVLLIDAPGRGRYVAGPAAGRPFSSRAHAERIVRKMSKAHPLWVVSILAIEDPDV